MPEMVPNAARLWITAGTLAYGLGPFIMDMNKTHLFHPNWTGHARLHLLWASVSQLAIAGLALWLTWTEAPDPIWRCRLAAIIGLCMTSGFWASMALRKTFQGTLHDPGGIPPIAGKVDGNVIAVLLIDGLLIIGLLNT